MSSSRQRLQGALSNYARSVLLAVSLLSPVSAVAATSARLDRDVIHQGDSVSLTIESDQAGHVAAPDWTPLRQDFEILSIRSGSRVQIVNGRRSDQITWSLELEPRDPGALVVPPLRVGAESTSALALQVAPPRVAASAAAGDPVFITVAVQPDDASVYVQQQFHYQVRLFSKHPIVDGVLGDPQPVAAVVERLGEDRRLSARVGGETYQVIERVYAIFPEQSGALEIPPITFRGHVASPKQERSNSDRFQRMDSTISEFFREPFFDQFFEHSPEAGSLFARTESKVRVHSEATSVAVEPRPVGYGGAHWLPTEALVLQDSWAKGVPTLRVGEALTRTITVEAKGAAGSQLPALGVAGAADIHVNPENPVRDSVTDGQWVHGRLQQSFSIMPTRGGEITLPEMRLNWWDTSAKVERVAVLPKIAAYVLPGTGATHNPAVEDAPATGAETRPNETAPVPALNVAPTWYDALGPWTNGLLLAGLLIAVLAWWRGQIRRRASAQRPVTGHSRPGVDAARV